MNYFKKNKLGDAFFVERIHNGDESCERKFYEHCRLSYKKVSSMMPSYGPKESDDLFQDAFLVVWTEIQNGKIYAMDGKVFRMQADGGAAEMKCSLATFVNDIAKNQYMKTLRHDGPAKISDISKAVSIVADSSDEKEKMARIRIVEECLSFLPKRCIEILTMFYYKKMSMDEIASARKENVSSNGVKTSKNKCMNKLKSDIYTKIGYGLE
ncbi:MAG: RNA polymerase sigma factor [Candidatus Cryptobacteroides sp.]